MVDLILDQRADTQSRVAIGEGGAAHSAAADDESRHARDIACCKRGCATKQNERIKTLT